MTIRERRMKEYKIKKELLEHRYGAYRRVWNGAHDDRGVFNNMYDMMLDALEEMKFMDDNYVWVAFNNKFKEDENKLEEIKTRFNKEFGLEV